MDAIQKTREGNPMNRDGGLIERMLSELWFFWLPMIAAFGGVVRTLNQNNSLTFKQRLAAIGISALTSAFAGLVTAFACRAADMDFWSMAVLIAISGWLGPEALALWGRKYKDRLP